LQKVNQALNIILILISVIMMPFVAYSNTKSRNSHLSSNKRIIMPAASGKNSILISDGDLETDSNRSRNSDNEEGWKDRERSNSNSNRLNRDEVNTNAHENQSIWTAANGFITVAIIFVVFTGLIFTIAFKKRRV